MNLKSKKMVNIKEKENKTMYTFSFKLGQTFWVVLPWYANDGTDIDEYLSHSDRVFYDECSAKVKYLDDYMDGYDKGEFPRIVKVMAEYYVSDVKSEISKNMEDRE